ncbi:hypothetical protein MUA04_02890 [Enterobacteriaceae bacterium H11S18]|uniref:hypothetical protein n=1 Tax=Dryocola clanedunensis TaxID=2925396 RepID=UPI0022F09696|nr:hypothetical protein [Dryocola clanedunensis]MCT4709145.1 hypothetical protein [Dryocola clanedunensis]
MNILCVMKNFSVLQRCAIALIFLAAGTLVIKFLADMWPDVTNAPAVLFLVFILLVLLALLCLAIDALINLVRYISRRWKARHDA